MCFIRIFCQYAVLLAFAGNINTYPILCIYHRSVNNHKSSYRPINFTHTTIPVQTNLWQIAGRHRCNVFSLDFGKSRRQVVQGQLDFLVFQMYGFQNKLCNVFVVFYDHFLRRVNCKQKLVVCPVPMELNI